MEGLTFSGLVFSLLLFEASRAIPQPPLCTVPPPELANGAYTEVPEERLALYHCLDGFWISGSTNLTCVRTRDGKDTWLPETWPECHPFEDCPEINLTNGYYEGDCCVPYDEVFFFCNDDTRYRLLGETTAVCLPTGSWSNRIPTCQDTYCKDPGKSKLDDRILFKGSARYDDCSPDGCAPETVAYYKCAEGFELVGERTITCTENGTWTHTKPKCRPDKYCNDFHVVNGDVVGERSGGEYFTPGDSAFVTCAPGYRVSGTDQLYCEDEGFWADDVPTCVETNCTRFKPAQHLIVDEFLNDNRTSFPEGTAINFQCDVGFLLEGVFSSTCRNGAWFGRMPKCDEIRCGHLRPPMYGLVVPVGGNYSTAVGTTLVFSCFQGYTLLGSNRRTCGLKGLWDGEPARCISNALLASQRRNGCEEPGIPDNGARYSSPSYSVGSLVKFECNRGYYMWGNDTIRCEENREWSARLPLCVGKFYYDSPRSVKNIITKEVGTISKRGNATVTDNKEPTGRIITLNGINPDTYYVFFLFDGSTSIGEKNFRTGISLAKAVTRKLDVNHTSHRIGAIVFEKTAKWGIRPEDGANEEMLLKKLDALKYTSGGTSISAALKELKENIARIRHNRALQKERAAKFAAFLITDGKANIGGDAGKDADELKVSFGVDVYCIGITGAVNMEALKKIASKRENIFTMRSYDSLQWLVDELTNATVDYSVCGVSYSHDPETGLDDSMEGRILGGTEAVTVWPWMVEIGHEDGKALCGGTIIHKKFVLTAAHCMHSKDAKTEFTPRNLRLRADQMRGELFYKEGETAFVIGWGKNGEANPESSLMQLATIISSRENCSRNATNFHEGMMCSISNKGDTCSGDSGGPLMQGVHRDEKTWTQVGIVSWGQGACKKNKFSYYTDVSFYIHWIQSQIVNANKGAAVVEPK
ncbi:complement factor B isoform X2 [Rhipicephalus microplus]|uniref:complement factor B isoform X2 n=1 Tax=Rhipicephalus microplus TaxID=6941 RepID=UPI003F6C6884